MYLSIATTHRPAADLGFLLHKHPDRLHETELPFGKSYVFYPEVSEDRCEAVMTLDIDPVGLVRGKGRGEGLLDQYVNDRPYAASSFLSVALTRTLRSAMSGVSRERQDLAEAAIPLEAVVTPLPARGGEAMVRALFEPLGWTVTTTPVEGPANPYVTLTLSGEARLSALLNHLYVLIPVLDNDKHYWVGDDEVAKLLAKGAGWLETHPARELIARRYLSHRPSLARDALYRLAPEAREEEAAPSEDRPPAREQTLEAPMKLNDARMAAVVAALKASGATAIADLGCGEGRLLQHLLKERWAQRLIGVDPAVGELEKAARRLKLHRPGGPDEGRITLLHGSVTYRDTRWEDVDAAVLVEVIEHLDPDRLPILEQVVFAAARPATVIVTTPNSEFNALFPNLAAGTLRHTDHRFEWTRAQFQAWAGGVAERHGYGVEYSGIGETDEALGAPTQMAIFRRAAA